MARKQNTTKRDSRIVGSFFLSFRPDGAVVNQGHVLEKVGDGAYLVQLFSWLTGDPTNQEIRTVADMCDQKWKLYDNSEDWVQAAEGHQRADARKGE